jgi:hypothetical protein
MPTVENRKNIMLFVAYEEQLKFAEFFITVPVRGNHGYVHGVHVRLRSARTMQIIG